MQIIRSRMKAWIERDEVLEKLQNNFRKGRRTEHNQFMSTQCHKMVRKCCIHFCAGFLDIKGVYHNVNMENLGEMLEQ